MEYGRNFNALVKATEEQNARINYSVFEGGSHMYTWSVAYTIEGIRDWLTFKQILQKSKKSIVY